MLRRFVPEIAGVRIRIVVYNSHFRAVISERIPALVLRLAGIIRHRVHARCQERGKLRWGITHALMRVIRHRVRDIVRRQDICARIRNFNLFPDRVVLAWLGAYT